MLNYDIESIVGKESGAAQKLRELGVATGEKLLKAGCDSECRRALAQAAGVDEALIYKWVGRADMLRVWGIGHLYAELLQEAGVSTLFSLRNQTAKKLHSRLLKINVKTPHSVKFLPGVKRLDSWIKEAKSLNSIITP